MRKKVINFITIIILLGILGETYINKEKIANFVIKNYIVSSSIVVKDPNTYTKSIDYIGFKHTNHFIPSNKEDLKNVIYTMLDMGWEEFSFYCDSNYTTYMDDIKEMTNDGTFAAINNYVHPYNSYKSLNVSINNYNVITIKITKNYTAEEIKTINSIVNNIMSNIITDNMSTEKKIEVFHDYIVEHTTYDNEEAKLVEQNKSGNLLSYKAYNVLVNGLGLCGGYSDTLAIFLNKIGVNNFKISTDKHVWNAVYINNEWKHIDMTWDDPVFSNGEQKLIHDYYLISTNKLKELDQLKHNYNNKFYLELQ